MKLLNKQWAARGGVDVAYSTPTTTSPLYDWQANSRRKSFCLSSFHDPLPAKRCVRETTAIITIVPCHALCQQVQSVPPPPFPPLTCHWTRCLRYSFIHSFIHSCNTSSFSSSSCSCSCSTHCSCSTPTLAAFCCHASVYTFTFTFTFTLRKHHHFYATSNAQGFVASTAAAAAQAAQSVEMAAQKALPTLRRI